MGPLDIVILAVIAVAVVLAVRSTVRSSRSGCSDCGSASTCAAHAQGGTCKAADDMLAHAEAALGERPSRHPSGRA